MGRVKGIETGMWKVEGGEVKGSRISCCGLNDGKDGGIIWHGTMGLCEYENRIQDCY